MKEAKPILFIKVNHKADFGTGGIQDFRISMEEKFNDYHVLCAPSVIDDVMELQVFNDANATETSIEELKQLIIKEINRNT